MTLSTPSEHHFYRSIERFKASHSVNEVAKILGKNPDTFKGKLNPNQARQLTYNEFRELVALDCQEGSSNLISGFVQDYGYQVVPVNVNSKADLNKTFINATQHLGEIAVELSAGKPNRESTNRIVESVHSLVASAMTIGYAAEERFNGISMSMLFGDMVTSGMTGGLLG